jgi:biopolymer transport protein ExbB
MEAFLHFVTHDWYFAIPMILMSLSGVALISWRLLLNFNARTDLDTFMPLFQKIWAQEGEDEAKEFCLRQSGMIPRKLFIAGLDTYKQGTAAMRRAMANVMEVEILPDLNFLLAPILAIAKIATMVGLLGTVISMIGTFNAIGQAAKGGGGGGVASSASEIGLALFATMLGLATAIPLVFAHVLLKDWIYRFELKMKTVGQKLIMIVQNTKPGSVPPDDELEARAEGRGRTGGAGATRPAAAADRTTRKG